MKADRGGTKAIGERVYINDALIPVEETRISILERGLLYGEGVFETMRAYEGVPFRSAQHLQRLSSAARRLGFSGELDLSGTQGRIGSLIHLNGLAEAYVRVTFLRGEGGFGMELSEPCAPQTIIVARPLQQAPESYLSHGIHAVISKIRRNETSPLSRMKTLNFLDNLLARREARAAGAQESVLLNTQGNVAEAAASNLFLVVDNELVTPDVDSGVLPGITRATIIALAGATQSPVIERPIAAAELETATEAFVTNSLVEVVPLVSINGCAIGNGLPGEVTRQFIDAYRALVRREIAASHPGLPTEQACET